MYRLGLRLTLRSGREALVRLLVTMAAVAIGVTVLLAVLAYFDAFQATNAKPAWETTIGQPIGPGSTATATSTANVELWNYSDTVFKGQTIEVLEVAALGPSAPVPPGVPRVPAAGQYYASPALAALLRTTPADELGDRFPGSQIGTIGDQALTGPNELAVFVGYQPAQLAGRSGTVIVDKIGSNPQTSIWTNYFRDAFGVGAVAFLLPILILIGMATRLAATRREERYAALRLVGATPRQINVIASVDASVSALFGTVVGIGIFELIRPLLADSSVTGPRYFSYLVAPTTAQFLVLLIGVPIASTVASLFSLRRVRISPLGVSRRTTPAAPGWPRILPLAVGLVLFGVGLHDSNSEAIGIAVYPGLLLTLIGLPIGGPWLTAQAARLLARYPNGAPSLLAARRLADNPKAAYRSVGGLVVAVFLGTMLAGLMPVINSTTQTPAATVLSNVLLDSFTYAPTCGNEVNCGSGSGPVATGEAAAIALRGLPPQTGATLLSQLQAFHGATVVPIYSAPSIAGLDPKPTNPAKGNSRGPGPRYSPYQSIVDCAAIAQISTLGQCAPGDVAAEADASNLSDDNPMDSTQPIVSRSNPAASADFAGLYLQSVLVKVDNPTTLEVVRTFLTMHTALSASGQAPRTFGEAVQARLNIGTLAQRIMNIVILLTLLVAGCSLTVAIGGSLVERKRPFTLLRLTGTSIKALYQAVFLEAMFPLLAATVVAAGAGYLLAATAAVKLGPSGTPVPTLGGTYFLTVGVGLVVSLLLIVGTLPFLGRITKPDSARFE